MEETMIEIKRLNAEHMRQIMLFDKTCFPTDFWKEEDWKELLEDPRAFYYALLDGKKLSETFLSTTGKTKKII